MIITRNENKCSLSYKNVPLYPLAERRFSISLRTGGFDMENMINGYVESCELVKARIAELTSQRNTLKEQGDICAIGELDLDRRIKLLYCEYGEMQEVISCLAATMRRREKGADT